MCVRTYFFNYLSFFVCGLINCCMYFVEDGLALIVVLPAVVVIYKTSAFMCESRYFQRSLFSLPKIICCNGVVHFLLFYASPRGEGNDQPSMYPIEGEIDLLFYHILLLC